MMLSQLFLLSVTIAVTKGFPGHILGYNVGTHLRQESGVPGQAVTGEYRWTSPDGRVYVIRYKADENGYVARGNVVPHYHDPLGDSANKSSGMENNEPEEISNYFPIFGGYLYPVPLKPFPQKPKNESKESENNDKVVTTVAPLDISKMPNFDNASESGQADLTTTTTPKPETESPPVTEIPSFSTENMTLDQTTDESITTIFTVSEEESHTMKSPTESEISTTVTPSSTISKKDEELLVTTESPITSQTTTNDEVDTRETLTTTAIILNEETYTSESSSVEASTTVATVSMTTTVTDQGEESFTSTEFPIVFPETSNIDGNATTEIPSTEINIDENITTENTINLMEIEAEGMNNTFIDNNMNDTFTTIVENVTDEMILIDMSTEAPSILTNNNSEKTTVPPFSLGDTTEIVDLPSNPSTSVDGPFTTELSVGHKEDDDGEVTTKVPSDFGDEVDTETTEIPPIPIIDEKDDLETETPIVSVVDEIDDNVETTTTQIIEFMNNRTLEIPDDYEDDNAGVTTNSPLINDNDEEKGTATEVPQIFTEVNDMENVTTVSSLSANENNKNENTQTMQPIIPVETEDETIVTTESINNMDSTIDEDSGSKDQVTDNPDKNLSTVPNDTINITVTTVAPTSTVPTMAPTSPVPTVAPSSPIPTDKGVSEVEEPKVEMPKNNKTAQETKPTQAPQKPKGKKDTSLESILADALLNHLFPTTKSPAVKDFGSPCYGPSLLCNRPHFHHPSSNDPHPHYHRPPYYHVPPTHHHPFRPFFRVYPGTPPHGEEKPTNGQVFTFFH